MRIEQKLMGAISQSEDNVFVRSEFAGFGSRAQVSRVLSLFVARGFLVRLGLGVYARAKPSVLSGAAIPVQPVDVLAPIALKKLGVSVSPSRLASAYNEGRSSQLPAGTVLNTGTRRISRRLGFGGRFVKYETSPKV